MKSGVDEGFFRDPSDSGMPVGVIIADRAVRDIRTSDLVRCSLEGDIYIDDRKVVLL